MNICNYYISFGLNVQMGVFLLQITAGLLYLKLIIYESSLFGDTDESDCS